MAEVKVMARAAAEAAHKRFLWAVSHVPDDRLDWSPAPTAKSTLAMARHVAGSNAFIAAVLRGDKVETGPFDEGPAAASREDIQRIVDASACEVIAAIDDLPDHKLEGMLQTPFGESPASFFVWLPARHMDGHASQVEYIQACLGDTDYHWK